MAGHGGRREGSGDKFYTYLYKDPIDNKPIYVGKGKGNRAYYHIYAKTQLGNTLRKRKTEGYVVEPVINYEADETTALEMEKFWINFYGRLDLGTGTLFNLTDGGEKAPGSNPWNKGKVRPQPLNSSNWGKGHKPWNTGKTKETDIRMQEIADKLSLSNKGKPGNKDYRATDETKAKISLGNKNRKWKPTLMAFEDLSYGEQRSLYRRGSDRVPKEWRPKSFFNVEKN